LNISQQRLILRIEPRSHFLPAAVLSSGGRSSGSYVQVPAGHDYVVKRRDPTLPQYHTAPYDRGNTEFIGRRLELQRVAADPDPEGEKKVEPGTSNVILPMRNIDRPRVLILYGAGGIGKHRLRRTTFTLASRGSPSSFACWPTPKRV
jgi:hypothetical protein